MATVHVLETTRDLSHDMRKMFEPFGGGRRFLKDTGEVFVKVNAVDFKEHCYTPPDIVEALVRYLYSEGATRVTIIDNCTQGNFTRLVFNVTGLDKAARRSGARILCLDEEPHEFVVLPHTARADASSNGYDQTEIAFPSLVIEKLMRQRERYTYLNVPKFKTHCMTTVTLGIKNQWGLVAQQDRIADHNYNLHRKFVDILQLLSPDFTLIDAREAIHHGHYPPRALLDRMCMPYGLLVGGDDVVSVDAVGCTLMGFPWNDVSHVRLAHERGFGQADLREVEIIGDVQRHRRSLSCDLLPVFPRDVDVTRGEELCCIEGCASNVLACLQMLYADFSGRGGFSIVMGRGHERKNLEKLQERILVVGKCAADEAGAYLTDRYGDRNVLVSYGCNNLSRTIAHLLRLMKIQPLRLVPLNPLHSFSLLARARLKGTNARIPPLVIH